MIYTKVGGIFDINTGNDMDKRGKGERYLAFRCGGLHKAIEES